MDGSTTLSRLADDRLRSPQRAARRAKPWCESRSFLVCLHCYTAEVIFIPPHRRHIRTHLRSKVLVVVEVVAIAQWGGDDDTSCSGNVGVYPFTRARCVGGRWRLRGDTISLDVRILGCCFGLCGASARQHSNCIEERVNPITTRRAYFGGIFLGATLLPRTTNTVSRAP